MPAPPSSPEPSQPWVAALKKAIPDPEMLADPDEDTANPPYDPEGVNAAVRRQLGEQAEPSPAFMSAEGFYKANGGRFGRFWGFGPGQPIWEFAEAYAEYRSKL